MAEKMNFWQRLSALRLCDCLVSFLDFSTYVIMNDDIVPQLD
jgi:hypothetical protein